MLEKRDFYGLEYAIDLLKKLQNTTKPVQMISKVSQNAPKSAIKTENGLEHCREVPRHFNVQTFRGEVCGAGVETGSRSCSPMKRVSEQLRVVES